MAYGFRPGDVQVPLSPPIEKARGIDPREPKTTLEVPSAEIVNGVLKLWRRVKKHSHIVIAFDTSGSMAQENRIANARVGAAQLIDLLGGEDLVSLLPFETVPRWAVQGAPLKTQREAVSKRVEGFIPGSGTALYDAIDVAYQYLVSNPQPGLITAIVVLTDGADRDSKLTLDDLLARIQVDAEKKGVRVFTIGYGAEAQKDVLKRIAEATQARFYEGKPENIREVFKEIATFF